METKFLKNLLASTAFAVASVLVLTSCGDDDPEPDPVPDTSIEGEYLFAGETLTWPLDDPTSIYTATRPSTYSFVFDGNTSTASLIITNADFLGAMPELDPMTFPGLDYVVGDNNTITVTCSDLIPEIGGRPFSAFPISDLEATIIGGNAVELRFVCDFRSTPYQVQFTGVLVN